VPDPPLFPADPDRRRRVRELEEWGEEELQGVPRRLMRWGLVRRVSLRRWLSEDADVPSPGLAAATGGPTARYYARASHANNDTVREDLARLPELLDRVDACVAEGLIGPGEDNAATFQVLASVRFLDEFEDLRGVMIGRSCTAAAHEVFPDYPGPIPAFLPKDWLPTKA
jgi:glutathione S-transferase